MNSDVRFAKCIALSDSYKTMRGWGKDSRMLPLKKAKILEKRGDVKIVSAHDELETRNYIGKLVHKKVIYTANFGDKDGLPTFKRLPLDWDLVCFTDNTELSSRSWKIVYCEPRHKDTTRCARELKLTPHLLFPHHDISAWMDANINITCKIPDYFDKHIEGNDFVLLKHWQNVVGPYHEIDRCIQLRKDSEEVLKEQGRAYRQAGLPIDQQVVWTAILLRRHNKQHVKEFNELWLSELNKWSRRDQISFPYCAWKLKLKYALMPGLGPWFRRVNHKWGGWK